MWDIGENYRGQLKRFSDDRIKDLDLIIVPDKIWHKGSQVSESDPESNLILFKKTYFENEDKSDEIAWLTHELAHCQEFFNSIEPKHYQVKMSIPAFLGINVSHIYPNNLVEKEAFSKQFEFLKESGKSRAEIWELIKNYYLPEDLIFFEKILDEIYGG